MTGIEVNCACAPFTDAEPLLLSSWAQCFEHYMVYLSKQHGLHRKANGPARRHAEGTQCSGDTILSRLSAQIDKLTHACCRIGLLDPSCCILAQSV